MPMSSLRVVPSTNLAFVGCAAESPETASSFSPSLSLTLLRHLLKKDNGTDDAVSGHGHVSASRLRVRIELDGPSFKLDSGRSNVATSHFFVNKSRSEPRGRSLSNEKWFQDDLAFNK